MARLESDRFPCARTAHEALDRRLVQRDIEVARVHTDQLFAGEAQALAGLPVDVHDPRLIVQQKKGVRGTVDKRAKTRFACAQLALGSAQLRDVLHDAELAY